MRTDGAWSGGSGPCEWLCLSRNIHASFPRKIWHYAVGTAAWNVDDRKTRRLIWTRPETERFDGYFRTDRAFVDTVTLLAANDVSARVNAIQSGQVHFAANRDARAVPLLQSLPTGDIQFASGSGFSGFNMMIDRAPFDNLALRQAMKVAIDREDFIQRIYGGQARLGNDRPVPPSAAEFSSDVPQSVYNPDLAREEWAVFVTIGVGPCVYRDRTAARRRSTIHLWAKCYA